MEGKMGKATLKFLDDDGGRSFGVCTADGTYVGMISANMVMELIGREGYDQVMKIHNRTNGAVTITFHSFIEDNDD